MKLLGIYGKLVRNLELLGKQFIGT